MLGLMRKHAGSWLIKILLGAIALAFALSWGVSSYYSGQQVAVKVNDEPISIAQVQEELGQLTEESRRQFGAQYDRIAPMLNLKERALNRLVDRTLLYQAARAMGVQASDVEVRQRVASYPAFQRNGQFDLKLYQRVLASNRLTPEGFESSQRGQLLIEKITTLVVGTALVSPLELDQALEAALTRVRGAYLRLADKDYLAQAKAEPQEVAAYYQAHQRDYLVPEKIKFSYVVFPLSAYRDQVKVGEDDIADAYERERGRYVRPEAAHVRHILVKLPEKPTAAEDEAAKNKAEDILKLAREGKEDFAALAKKNSEGPTAPNGGDLGFIERGQTVAPFEEAAFALKPGEMGLARSQFGWHVIKMEEHRPGRIVPLDEVRGEIKARLEDQLARERAEVAAERAFEEANKGKALADIAKEHKLNLSDTPALSADDGLPGLKGVKGLFEAFEGLGPGQAAPVFSFEGGSVLAVLGERLAEQARPLDEVREDARLALLAEQAQLLARQAAQKLIDELAKDKDPVKALLAMKGAKQTEWITAEDDVAEVVPSVGLVQALFLRPDSRPLVAEPLKVSEGFLVAALAGREKPSAGTMADKRDDFRQRLLAQRQRELQQRFVGDLRAKAQIKVLAKL